MLFGILIAYCLHQGYNIPGTDSKFAKILDQKMGQLGQIMDLF
jgi:hypothetical protein